MHDIAGGAGGHQTSSRWNIPRVCLHKARPLDGFFSEAVFLESDEPDQRFAETDAVDKVIEARYFFNEFQLVFQPS